MRKRTAFALWFSLATVGCSGSARPTEPTSLSSNLATMQSGPAQSGSAQSLSALTAQSGGNSAAAQLCQDGGYLNLVRTDGTGFRNVGECVSYAAHGGTFGGGPACPGVPGGIISWWPGEGNAQDIVGHYDGTLQGGATFSTGIVGQDFSLDGIDDAIVVNNNA